MKSELTVRCRW